MCDKYRVKPVYTFENLTRKWVETIHLLALQDLENQVVEPTQESELWEQRERLVELETKDRVISNNQSLQLEHNNVKKIRLPSQA